MTETEKGQIGKKFVDSERCSKIEGEI